MSTKSPQINLAALCILVLAGTAHADRYLHVNGLSWHPSGDFNEQNWGIGYSECWRCGRTRAYVSADVFVDSMDQLSGYAGVHVERRFGYFGAGLIGGVMYRDDVGHPFPFVLPAVSVGQSTRLVVTYVPPIRKEVEVWAAQIRIALPRAGRTSAVTLERP